MKKAVLSDGQTIVFSKDTPDDVIKETVKRIIKSKDSFSTAIEKQTVALNNNIHKIVEGISQSGREINKSNISTIKPVLDQISKHVGMSSKTDQDVILAVNVNSQFVNNLIAVVKENNHTMREYVDAQRENSKILNELVKVMKAPKRVTRDKNGDLVGIKIDG